MNTNRMNPVVVGILFIIGTVTGVIAASIEVPILGAPDYLAKLSANAGMITTVAFLQFIMAVACAGIGIGLYPVMKKYHEGQAVAVAGFRIMEGVFQVAGGVYTISLLSLGQEFVKTGAANPASFQTLGTILKAGNNWMNNGPMLLCWCIAAFLYYSVFYRYKIVPRWLSAWGLVGITLTFLSSIWITLTNMPGFDTLQMAANLPIFVQEMVFAVWLIVKGYSSSTPAHQPVFSQLGQVF
jgi:hypothetical protein